MYGISREWVCAFLCLMVTLALPAGLLGQDEAAPAPAGPATPPAAPAPPADPTAVLKVIPADATALLVVRNLKELDADILGVTEKLGFPLAAIGFPNPLELAKEYTGITDGLNDNASLAFVVLSCADLETVDEVPARLVVLIPCTDVAALTATMNPEKEGDVIKLELLGQPSVAAAKDGFLVVGQNPEAVKAVLQAKGGGIITSMAPDRFEAYKTQDVFGWANFRGFSQAIRQEVTNLLKTMMLAGNPMAAETQVDTSVDQARQAIDAIEELSFGLTLDQKIGLKLTGYGRVRPDSEHGALLAAMKTTGESLLTGLPDEPTVFAMGTIGGAGNPKFENMFQRMLDQLLDEEMLADEFEPAKLKSLKESTVGLKTGIEHASFSISALPMGSQDGLVGVTFVAKVVNSQQAQGELRKLFNIAKEMLIKTAVDQEDISEEEAKAATEAITWKENAEKLTGASVDHFIVDIEKFPDVDPDKVAEVKGVIGQEGVLVRVAAVGENHIAITFGGGAKRFAQVADHIQKGQAPLADKQTFKMIAGRLPTQNRLAEVYLGIDQVLTLYMNIAKQLDQPVMFPLAMKETTPIAGTITQVDKTAVQGDLLIPIELAQSVMELAQPFIQMMLMGGKAVPGQPVPGQPMPGQPPPGQFLPGQPRPESAPTGGPP